MHKQAHAQTLAARYPALLLAAEQIAAAVAAGVHGRKRPGPGEQFWQYRRYQPGDAAGLIDWRASARGTHLLVREREWEAAQTALLWLDHSESFSWASSRKLPHKSERGTLLLLALADLLLRGGERVGLLGTPHPPMSGRGILGRLAVQLDQITVGGDAAPLLAHYPRNARLVLFGDFLDPMENLTHRFKHLFAQGLHAHVVQILDPAEVSLPWTGRVLYEGLEGEGHYLAARSETIKNAYQQKMAEHQDQLKSMTARLGWSYQLHLTHQRPELALLAMYQYLSEAS